MAQIILVNKPYIKFSVAEKIQEGYNRHKEVTATTKITTSDINTFAMLWPDLYSVGDKIYFGPFYRDIILQPSYQPDNLRLTKPFYKYNGEFIQPTSGNFQLFFKILENGEIDIEKFDFSECGYNTYQYISDVDYTYYPTVPGGEYAHIIIDNIYYGTTSLVLRNSTGGDGSGFDLVTDATFDYTGPPTEKITIHLDYNSTPRKIIQANQAQPAYFKLSSPKLV